MALLADAGQVAGPVLAGLAFLASGWLAPLCCACGALSGAYLSLPTRALAGAAERPAPMPRLFGNRALLALLAISVSLGAGQGLVQVAVPTLAGHWHRGDLAGPLLAAFALGSVLGGLWFGARRWRAPVLQRYLASVATVGVLLAPAALAGSAIGLAPLLLVAGLAFGPATISMFEALDVVAPAAGTEALTWVTTAEASGAGAGSALAGVLVVHAGAAVAFLSASLVLALPASLALVLRRARGRQAAAAAAGPRARS